MKNFLALAAATLLATPVAANVSVAFLEGAPKDRFVVTNSSSCDLAAATLTLDLSTSRSGVIFDVTGSGAGVEVFQPFEIVLGHDHVGDTPTIADGDRAVTLTLKGLPSGQTVAFTIDVDDTDGGREITVAENEISGATATVETASYTATEAFGETAALSVPLPACS